MNKLLFKTLQKKLKRAITLAFFSGIVVLTSVATAQKQPVSLVTKEGYIKVNDSIQLFYSIVGNSKDTLVILHGGPGLSFNYLLPDLQPLAADVTLLFYDQRGAGHSTMPKDSTEYEMKWHLYDLEKIREHFKLKKINLLGHSWGGLIAASYAVQYPNRLKRLILLGSDPPAKVPYWAAFKPSSRIDSTSMAQANEFNEKWGNTKDSIKLCWDFWGQFIKGYLSDPVNARFIWGDVCNMPQATLLNPFRRYSRVILGNWDLTQSARNIPVPTLIIHGADDPMPLEGARRWHQELPNSSMMVIPRTGHFPHVESPEIFFPLVTTFLQGHNFPDSITVNDLKQLPLRRKENNDYSRLFTTIVKQTERFKNAVSRQDAMTLASLYSKNGEVYPPTVPLIKSQSQIKAFWESAFSKGLKTADLQTIKIEGTEKLLTETGKYKLFGDGNQLLDMGKYIVIWERVNTEWKIKEDIFNSSLKTLSSFYRE